MAVPGNWRVLCGMRSALQRGVGCTRPPVQHMLVKRRPAGVLQTRKRWIRVKQLRSLLAMCKEKTSAWSWWQRKAGKPPCSTVRPASPLLAQTPWTLRAHTLPVKTQLPAKAALLHERRHCARSLEGAFQLQAVIVQHTQQLEAGGRRRTELGARLGLGERAGVVARAPWLVGPAATTERAFLFFCERMQLVAARSKRRGVLSDCARSRAQLRLAVGPCRCTAALVRMRRGGDAGAAPARRP